MLLPVFDQNPIVHIRFQAITFLIIAGCIGVFVWEATLPATTEAEQRFYRLAFVPARLFGTADGSLAPDLIWGLGTIASSMFLHAGFWHLLGNMLFLWVYGDNVEDATGHFRFVIFYLLCGVAAAIAQAAADIHTAIPMVGASGAISGVLGAYLILHPRARILVMTFFFLTFQVRAMWLIGFWIAYQVILGVLDDGKAGVAWWAHVGGFVAGAALIPLFKRRTVPLFDGPRPGVGKRRKGSIIPRIPPRRRR